MAHNLNFDEASGEYSLFLANDSGWHSLGQVVQGTRSWEEVIKIAHMDWDVEKRPLYGLLNDQYVELPTWGIFRSDNNSFLGSVGKGYSPIQNRYAFEFIDSILEAEEGMHYESAGVLGKGERIWAMAKIPYDFTIGPTDDKILPFLLFATSHDGSLSAQAKLTTWRVVCENTLRGALSSEGAFVKIKHTKDSHKRLEVAKQLVKGVALSVSSLKEKFEFLGQRMLNKESYLKILDRIFPVPKGKEEESSTRRNNIMMEVTRLFENNDGNQFPVHRGTCLNLLNAITEYTDHVRTTRITEDRKHLDEVQARAETAIFGSGAKFKEDAFEIIMDEAAGCQERPYRTFTQRAIGSGDYTGIKPIEPTSLLDSIIEENH